MSLLRWLSYSLSCLVLSTFIFAEEPVDINKNLDKIRMLGGKYSRDESQPDRPVRKIDFSDVVAAGKQRFSEKYLHLLEDFSDLDTLVLTNTPTTDESLPVINRLTHLKRLHLGGTKISAEGLLKLDGLKQLELLNLWVAPASEPLGLTELRALQRQYPPLPRAISEALKKDHPGLVIHQVPPAIVQPNQTAFGIVGRGSIAEASVCLFMPGSQADDLVTSATASKFLRVEKTDTRVQQFGQAGDFICHDLFFSLDTSAVGELNGEIRVRLGEAEIEFPVTAEVRELDQPDYTRILIVETPYTRFSTGDATTFEPWRELVAEGKLAPQYLDIKPGLPVLRDLDLAQFDVVLIADVGLIKAEQADFDRLKQFAESGGRVVVAANRFMVGTVPRANEFLKPLGLTMLDIEPGIRITLVEIHEAQLTRHPLTKFVESLKFHRPSPVTVDDPEKGTLLVTTDVFPGQGLVAVTKVGQGEVVALGVSMWWNWISSEAELGADNSRMLQNLLSKPRKSP